jgi:quercetin dioxygenase-like cupin family protein
MLLNTLPRATRAALFATSVITLTVVGAHAQQAPTGNQGFKALKTNIVELGNEIDGMAGRQLRFRLLQVEPGGHIGMHSHKDRPAVVYFIQGVGTMTFGDGTVKVLKAGDTGSATKDTTHWLRNDGKEPVVFVAVDILHKK